MWVYVGRVHAGNVLAPKFNTVNVPSCKFQWLSIDGIAGDKECHISRLVCIQRGREVTFSDDPVLAFDWTMICIGTRRER